MFKKLHLLPELVRNEKEDGYCYIGYDRGMRNCSEIHQGETCMSGDIFPSLEICMFPNLRR